MIIRVDIESGCTAVSQERIFFVLQKIVHVIYLNCKRRQTIVLATNEHILVFSNFFQWKLDSDLKLTALLLAY